MRRLERDAASHLLQRVHEGLREALTKAELKAAKNLVRDLPADTIFNSAAIDRLPISWPLKAALIAELIAVRCGNGSSASPAEELAKTFDALVVSKGHGVYDPPEAVQDLLARFVSAEGGIPDAEAARIADGTLLSLGSVDRKTGAVVLNVDRPRRRTQQIALERETLAAWDLPSLRRLHELLEPMLAETTENPLLRMYREELEREEGGVLPELVGFIKKTIEEKVLGRKASLEEIDALLRKSLGKVRVGEVDQAAIQALVEAPDPPIIAAPPKKRGEIRAVDLSSRDAVVLALWRANWQREGITDALDLTNDALDAVSGRLCTRFDVPYDSDLLEVDLPELDALAPPMNEDDLDAASRAFDVLVAGRAYYVRAMEQLGVFRAMEKLQSIAPELKLETSTRVLIDGFDKKEWLRSSVKKRDVLYASLDFDRELLNASASISKGGNTAATRRTLLELETKAADAELGPSAPLVEDLVRFVERALETFSQPDLLKRLGVRGPMSLIEKLLETSNTVAARKKAIAAREILHAISTTGATRNERGELAKLTDMIAAHTATWVAP